MAWTLVVDNGPMINAEKHEIAVMMVNNRDVDHGPRLDKLVH